MLRRRLQEIAAGLDADQPDQVWQALELAAALGHEVSLREWHPACAAAGLPAYPRAVAVLSRARLALGRSGSFRFLHGALRETLQRHAQDQRRWRTHHEQCAITLGNLYPPGTPGIASRIGRHFARAHQWQRALAPLLSGADEARVASDFDRAYELYDRHLEALTHADPDDLNDQRALNLVRRARTLAKHNNLTEAAALLDDIDASELSDVVHAEFLFAKGILARGRGDVREGLQIAERCYAINDRIGHRFGRLKALGLRADLLPALGRLEEAIQVSRAYMDYSRDAGELNDLAAAQMQFGNLQLYAGDNDQALHYLELSDKTFESVGNKYGVAQAKNAIGEVYRLRGDTDRALEYYRSALKTLTRIGVNQPSTVRFNIGLCLVNMGELKRAQPHFDEGVASLRQTESWGYLAIALLGQAACACADDDWTTFDAAFDEALELLERTGFAHQDLVALTEAADSAGQPQRAARARQLADQKRQQLSSASS